MEDFWLEHRDKHCEYSIDNWCAKIDGIIAVNDNLPNSNKNYHWED
jgi:hypothetical protein